MPEFETFLDTTHREIPNFPDIGGFFTGKNILITGGTGCIGSALIGQLSKHAPRLIRSLSRHPERRVRQYAAVDYQPCDIRDHATLMQRMSDVEWDIVFHVAAQRDPGLAETEVRETVGTNVFGAKHILDIAEATGIPNVVFASTGKALRPFSPDVYTATKRIAEWELNRADGIMCRSAVRFTHVVDNSIIYDRLCRWCKSDEPIRLHSEDIYFYIQSARECAQLLMGAAAYGMPWYAPGIHAITNLGPPMSLYELTKQVKSWYGSNSPINIIGYEKGYEEVPFPGLYDPMTAGDVSPLINAFEAALAVQPYPGVDAFPITFYATTAPEQPLWDLHETWDSGSSLESLRLRLNDMSWAVMAEFIRAAEPHVLARIAKLCRPHYDNLRWPHTTMVDIIEKQDAEVNGSVTQV